jgi:2-dehydropantoate 2-reductase
VEPLAGKLRHDTIILCIQNGLAGEDAVKTVIGGVCPVLRGITQFGAIFRAPGVIEYKVEGYTLVERDPHGVRIAALLTEGGLDGRVVDDIRIEVWRKLIFNCVINPITSITAGEVGSIADPRLDPLKRLVIDECLAVARAAGVPFDADPGFDFLQAIADVFGRSTNVASMRQDLLKGKATEIEHMNGAVVELGRRLGVDCPVNAALAAIIRAMEARGRFVVP